MPLSSVKCLFKMTTQEQNPKPVKRSVDLAMTNQGDLSQVLLVLRPDDDDEFPGMWGLPAASMKPREKLEDVVRRIGTQKLGVDLNLGPQLGFGTQERPEYVLEMTLLRAIPERHTGGISVDSLAPKDVNLDVTLYADWRWGDPMELEAAASDGSLCIKLLLDWLKSRNTA